MKKLTCIEPGNLVLQEDTNDWSCPENWVPLDIQRVGICGTDYHIYTGTQPYFEYPRVMGHEVAGRVSDDYQGSAFAKGELVIANPYLACGTCHACLLGKRNCCSQISVIGVHRDGAMCDKFALPPENLISADGLTPDQAAMVEFLAIGRHAVARTRLIAGAKTLVVGGGPIGLACALFARLDQAEVTVADTSVAKLAMLHERFGFDGVDAKDTAVMDSLESTFTHVFDATGSIQAMNAALRYVANGGSYTLVSVVKGDLCFADPEFHKRETTLFSSRNALQNDFEYVINAIKNGDIDTDKIGTHATTMENAAANLAKWASDRDQVIKAIITVQEQP